MEGALAALQFNGNGKERLLLLGREYGHDFIHVPRKARYRQQLPAMTSRNIVEAPIVAVAIIQGDRTSEVRHRLGARPIGVVLMPGHHAPMMAGLKKAGHAKTHRTT